MPSLIILTAANSYAQAKNTNQYGLTIINQKQVYLQTIRQDTNRKMVDLRSIIPSLVFDIRYSGTNNFMQERLYKAALKTTYLRSPAAYALQKVQEELMQQGLGLKIWDAYRPYSVTEKMWEKVKDERYAANPKFGSGHNRGIAVDLTLIELPAGKEKNMGTGFDNFSDTAHSGYKTLPEDVLQNRQTLRTVMEKNGFKVLDTEWWHFYLPHNNKFELMDIGFKELEKTSKQQKKKRRK